MNLELVTSETNRKLDVVFYGDSITEGWRGTQFGHPRDRVEGAEKVFESFFSKGSGGDFDGLALGISGDTVSTYTSPLCRLVPIFSLASNNNFAQTSNLLWRIQNGELPSRLRPRVFWLLIGTNDLGNTWCSPELVVVGVLRVVEEILSQTSSSHVVINGLLPRTFNAGGYVSKPGPVKPSVWEAIKVINQELELYATSRERVSYFETNVFFVDPNVPTKDLQIDVSLMSDYLHPNAKGYQLWGNEIVQKLHQITEQHQN